MTEGQSSQVFTLHRKGGCPHLFHNYCGKGKGPGSAIRTLNLRKGSSWDTGCVRKVRGRLDIISCEQSFHGRTISTASAIGQVSHRERFNPLMPNYRFIPYDDIPSLEAVLDHEVAAVIIEPIQGEGGVQIPSEGYLGEVGRLCKRNGSLLCYL